ncbi:GNAT family N-acetyltransferase [Parvicella tangerina]|uniref:N-acetyltransferase domain-containing protein n=1 Tax=Parvicella tangerina TaxID=2829795 RepID=A0A916JLS7_9FLAO|nr:GNAT family N-acetyltransferase [Parvicella tangerina]CAG5080362.1 hypothetical protein CRYO30217_01274 [Parvicella tangerina]
MKHLLTGEETSRLRFRLLEEGDFDDWLPLFFEKDVAKFLGMDTNLSPTQMCEKWFEKSLQRYREDTGGMNVLVDKNSGALVGQCGILIQEVENEKRFEVGYSILPKFWKMGFASEASQKCLSYAFNQNLSPSIISIIHIDNIASARVAQKNGMSIEKTHIEFHGSPVNIYSISEEKWRENNF